MTGWKSVGLIIPRVYAPACPSPLRDKSSMEFSNQNAITSKTGRATQLPVQMQPTSPAGSEVPTVAIGSGASTVSDMQKHSPSKVEDTGEAAGDSGDLQLKKRAHVDTSAQALLILTQSVHEASQATADRRGRVRDSVAVSEDEEISPSKRRRVSTKRKPTMTARKEEMAMLADEIRKLNARVAFLNGQVSHELTDQDIEDPTATNAVLRGIVQEHELKMASVRSVVSWFRANEWAVPAHCYIHLPKTHDDRYRALQALKPRQLRLARRYVLERSRHLNLNAVHVANERFVNNNGDSCFIQFALLQFPPNSSAREVFEAASYFTSCLEISLTDGAGQLTIREEDSEFDDPAIVHNRFLTTMDDGVEAEGNLVLFRHFDEEEDCGLVVGTFVDHDEQYPYRSCERLRQDSTAILLISQERDHIVVRRFGYVRIHQNKSIAADPAAIQELSESVTRWGNAILAQMRARFSV